MPAYWDNNDITSKWHRTLCCARSLLLLLSGMPSPHSGAPQFLTPQHFLPVFQNLAQRLPSESFPQPPRLSEDFSYVLPEHMLHVSIQPLSPGTGVNFCLFPLIPEQLTLSSLNPQCLASVLEHGNKQCKFVEQINVSGRDDFCKVEVSEKGDWKPFRRGKRDGEILIRVGVRSHLKALRIFR